MKINIHSLKNKQLLLLHQNKNLLQQDMLHKLHQIQYQKYNTLQQYMQWYHKLKMQKRKLHKMFNSRSIQHYKLMVLQLEYKLLNLIKQNIKYKQNLLLRNNHCYRQQMQMEKLMQNQFKNMYQLQLNINYKNLQQQQQLNHQLQLWLLLNQNTILK